MAEAGDLHEDRRVVDRAFEDPDAVVPLVEEDNRAGVVERGPRDGEALPVAVGRPPKEHRAGLRLPPELRLRHREDASLRVGLQVDVVVGHLAVIDCGLGRQPGVERVTVLVDGEQDLVVVHIPRIAPHHARCCCRNGRRTRCRRGRRRRGRRVPPPNVQFAKLPTQSPSVFFTYTWCWPPLVACTHVAQMAPVESRSMTSVSLFWPSIGWKGVPAGTYLCARSCS